MLVILGFPHLVLANVSDDDRVAISSLAPQVVDDVRGVKVPAIG